MKRRSCRGKNAVASAWHETMNEMRTPNHSSDGRRDEKPHSALFVALATPATTLATRDHSSGRARQATRQIFLPEVRPHPRPCTHRCSFLELGQVGLQTLCAATVLLGGLAVEVAHPHRHGGLGIVRLCPRGGLLTQRSELARELLGIAASALPGHLDRVQLAAQPRSLGSALGGLATRGRELGGSLASSRGRRLTLRGELGLQPSGALLQNPLLGLGPGGCQRSSRSLRRRLGGASVQPRNLLCERRHALRLRGELPAQLLELRLALREPSS